ncbi:MAG: serine dehydratase subunit alpha family protein [Faecousia sp.]
MLKENVMHDYIAILSEELVPATGCTEPIAIAYCAATVKKLLGKLPERVTATVSGNILKNVKSVVVPNTGGRKGIRPAIAAGMVAGDPDRDLQVIANLPPEALTALDDFLRTVDIDVICGESPCKLDIDIQAVAGSHSARVRITNHHTNIVHMERDGQVLRDLPVVDAAEEHMTDKSCLNVEDIVRFADTVPLEAVQDLLLRQIEQNTAIAEEGLRGAWGAQIGRILLEDYGDDIKQRAKAYAAAGSDARMSGCEMPVVILSGSGNQGITACLPVVVYAKHIGATQEQLIRALLVSDLVTIHQKSGIGRLSAYCGAISAGVGAGAGICYLLGGGFSAVAHTVVNAVAILSGTICDGAKPSCAAKIAAAVDAGIMGYRMYLHHREFLSGEGIVAGSVDDTIANVGLLAQQGMRQTDHTILRIMQDGECL